MAESVKLTLNDAAIKQLLGTTSGPVGKETGRRGQKILNKVKQNESGRPGPNVRTGRLRNSASMELSANGREVSVKIGTNVSYATFLEKGTRHMPAYPSYGPALDWARSSGIVSR